MAINHWPQMISIKQLYTTKRRLHCIRCVSARNIPDAVTSASLGFRKRRLKTLLAGAMPGILPRMSIEEALDVTRIYSVADQLPSDVPLIRNRPFRSPHHTISHAGLVGGGNIPKPGEISLAHRGVLFLDEFPEFGTRVLEVMRQPMEERKVTISRAKVALDFPASFMLLASMNPCPCGFFSDPQKACTCAPAVVTRYQKRISGPLLDRIDIHIEVPRVDYEKLSGNRVSESSETIRARIQYASDLNISYLLLFNLFQFFLQCRNIPGLDFIPQFSCCCREISMGFYKL